MTDTYNAIAINVEAVGPPREQTSDTSTRHIPGGNASYIDLGGLPPRTLTYTLFFSTAADYTSFESQVGQGAYTLTTTADGTNTAVLLSLKRSERNLSTNGETTATAEFVLV